MDAEKEVGSKEEYMAMRGVLSKVRYSDPPENPPGKVKKEITSKDRLRRTYGGRAELEENEEGSDRIWLH